MVTLRYAQVLQFEQQGLRLLIPTVIAPRYGDPVQEGGLRPHQVSMHDLMAEYPFDIVLRIHGELAKARVSSPSHPIGMASDSGMLSITLGKQTMLDRDFVLVLDQLTQGSICIVAKDGADPKRFVALASFCPRIPNDSSLTLALKILVDCSGSMAGDSIAAAKRALQSIVQQFSGEDRFSLSRFGGTVEHRSRSLWRATDKTRISAQRWVGDLDADMGGTEMEEALASTFRLGESTGSDVLLVTDGEIEAIERTIEMAKASMHRLFIVGIGSSPAEGHLRRLAEATGGACDFVAPGEAVAPAVLRMFARLRSPRLSGVQVAWNDGLEPIWASPVSASVFNGDTVNVFALFDRMPTGSIRLLSKHSVNAELEEIAIALPAIDIIKGDTVARMAASARIPSTASDDAVKLAVDYQLITDRTNFLLVHERAESDKASEMPELRKVAPMAPAGWSGAGSAMFSIDRSTLSRPAVFRRSSPRTMKSSGSLDSYHLPSFLRRDNSEASRIPSKYLISDEGYEGLSPIGLCEILRKIDKLSWPKTLKELNQIGLGKPVSDWIGHLMQGADSEMIAIRTFAYLMSNDDTYEALLKQLGFLHGFKALSHKLVASLSSGRSIPVGIDLELLERMREPLSGMTANSWPEEAIWPAYGAID